MSESYKKTIAKLRLSNSGRAEAFISGLDAMLDEEISVQELDRRLSKIIEAVDRIVANPRLNFYPSLCIQRTKATDGVLLSLGFRSKSSGHDIFAYEGEKSQSTITELSVANQILSSFKATAKERRAHILEQKLQAHLKPEPPFGAAGTVGVTLVLNHETKRRNFFADDCLSDLLAWLATILPKGIQSSSILAISGSTPPLRLDEHADPTATLQRLGFWPSVRLQLSEKDLVRSYVSKVESMDKPQGRKPKPSDIFKSISQRFAHDDHKYKPPKSRLDATRHQDACRPSASSSTKYPALTPAPA